MAKGTTADAEALREQIAGVLTGMGPPCLLSKMEGSVPAAVSWPRRAVPCGQTHEVTYWISPS
jgi:hypothetical protein